MKTSARALGLDLQNEWVWRGKQHLNLRPKAFAVLRYLAEHPGRLVTKAEIVRAVWPDTVAGDEALTACIREIRQVLGDTARGPHYIETVHRRGYRFIGPLREQESGVRDRVDTPSIVVLPFTNLSGDPEQEYFSDGITEELTASLSRLSGLFVISRNTAFFYKGKAVKTRDINTELGVRYVLEGSTRKAGDQVRITAQLIDATTDHHLWSERYDRPLTDLFALQDEIVQRIVTTLKLQLTLQEQGHIVRKRTDNLEAYDSFLRGVEYHWRLTKEANAQARQMFEKAVALDPQYAEAYAWLGVSYWQEWIWRWSAAPQTLEQAFALAQQALALDDSLPWAHSLLSLVYAWKQQYDQAITEGERAIALDPNNADSYSGQAQVLNFAGRPEDALRAVEQAMRLNPRYPPIYLFHFGSAYLRSGRYAEAIATLKETISRSPNLLPAYFTLAASYLLQWVAQQSPAAQTLEPAVAAAQRAVTLNDSFH